MEVNSEKYLNSKSLLAKLLINSEKQIDTFLSVNKGLIDHPEFSKVMNFPKRFLKRQSVLDVPEKNRVIIESWIEELFLLGLFTHFILVEFKTRNSIDNVRVQKIFDEFFLQSLVAKIQLAQYNKDTKEVPSFIFAVYYNHKVENFIKKKLNAGPWKRGKIKSFLENLFFSGILLGMVVDMETKEIDSAT